jgi:hypothetical protein
VHYEIYNSRISPKVYSIIFMTSDVISLILQSVGGGIADAASTESGKNEGTNIMVAGLSFQVISLVLFMFLAAEFFFKVKKDRAHMRNLSGLGAEPKGYKSFVWGMCIPLSPFPQLTRKSSIRHCQLLDPHPFCLSCSGTCPRFQIQARQRPDDIHHLRVRNDGSCSLLFDCLSPGPVYWSCGMETLWLG